MILDLPLPPSLNNAFADMIVKDRVRRIPSREYKAWKVEAAALVLEQWAAQGQPSFGRHFALHWQFNIDHRGDIGNREKCGTDILVATIPGFPGDQWCDRIVIERTATVEAARVTVSQM